ncbi:GNAT family N-acetyltransferase [Dactylosporangium sp. NPDC000244]|uniref:GNAT family N-acetyltransferase n=1 Tax=Dactylosporangium sp. NPDC000244 TaxID=3154365 RepID=UPI003327B390
MTEPLAITHHPASAVPAMRTDLIEVHTDARAELLDQPFYSADRFWERFENYITAPDFHLVVGHIGDVIVGYTFGSPLPADTKWWQHLQGSDDPDLTRETGQRTFAFREILVRKQFQRRGIAHRLHDALLRGRTEERAALLVRSDNPAGELYRRWGWRQIGFLQPYPDSPRFEAMIIDLHSMFTTTAED